MEVILDFGLPIFDWRQRRTAARRERANKKFKIQNPKLSRRRGVSILEVIFAILVTTIGLLAALTVFPVSAALARKGRIADETAIAGKAAFHAFDTYGMRRPDMWLEYDPDPNYTFDPPLPMPPRTSYCLDPRFITFRQNDVPAAMTTYPLQATWFPYGPFAAVEPRMRRIALSNGVPSVPPDAAPLISWEQADAMFTFDDDFTLIRPRDGSLPAHGSYKQVDSDNDGVPDLMTTRNTGGHLSWMATLVPKHELYAPDAVMENDQFVLSVVIFHDRPLIDLSIDPGPPASELYLTAERVVGVNFADAGGLGYAGGETLLIWPPTGTIAANQTNYEIAKQQMKVRAGDWIMLAGNAVHAIPGPGGNPILVPIFKWYRVTEADHEPEYHTVEQHYEVAVSLAGQDWDITLANQQAFLITGVVGVFEKTVRLETGVGF
jgi:hypothetical protein